MFAGQCRLHLRPFFQADCNRPNANIQRQIHQHLGVRRKVPRQFAAKGVLLRRKLCQPCKLPGHVGQSPQIAVAPALGRRSHMRHVGSRVYRRLYPHCPAVSPKAQAGTRHVRRQFDQRRPLGLQHTGKRLGEAVPSPFLCKKAQTFHQNVFVGNFVP